ncbi:hypothetical protein IWW47_003252 [Coemansia sp. RSA 2052]|nr:hypothetical protein IWW47_003252 [Coemansia sp. RSA 2052]
MQKCLEDRRSSFVSVDSATFSGVLQLEKRPSYQQFLVLEKDHFTLFSYNHPPVKFSYKSRNAVMSLLWRSALISDISITKFVEVDGRWQLEQLPVLYFVFGKDADTLRSNYLIDGNTITEYYEPTAAMDMAELAVVARSKARLCVSHFFIVNHGKDYWAVDTKDPSISYAFGPSTKTRTISKLADGSLTLQELIDEEKPLAANDEPHTSQNPDFKLRDVNGEEVVEGEEFALHIPSKIYEDEYEDKRIGRSMYEGKDWVEFFGEHASGTMDSGANFRVAVVDGITYLTFEGKFLQIDGADCSSDVVVLPDVPSKQNRIQICYNDDGDVVLSQWGTGMPICLEWVKAACGMIALGDADDIACPESVLKLRLVKV